ncbi:MAG: hypothetical protein AB8I56_04645 [Anaerolineales bacterium]
MDNQQLDRDQLEVILQAENIDQLTYPEMVDLFLLEKGLGDYQPDPIAHQDPRNSEQVLFNTSRANRPHDNVDQNINQTVKISGPEDCIICAGKTTGVVDVADLSQGFTFINKNLFPIVYPVENPSFQTRSKSLAGPLSAEGNPAFGLHFLQWTSSIHTQDWHNMSSDDLIVVMKRLSVLEKTLLTTSLDAMPSLEKYGDHPGRSGFVSIIKNSGSPVGGSIEHGHQQVVFSNLMPRRVQENLKFKLDRGVYFAEYVLQENPPQLLVRAYEQAVLIVPYFMRRPFDMLLILKDTHKAYLHELSSHEIASITAGWQDGIKLLRAILPVKRRPIAFNVVIHNGPGAGLYFEFLPYSQEEGGFEKLGLSVCQSNPALACDQLKELVTKV